MQFLSLPRHAEVDRKTCDSHNCCCCCFATASLRKEVRCFRCSHYDLLTSVLAGTEFVGFQFAQTLLPTAPESTDEPRFLPAQQQVSQLSKLTKTSLLSFNISSSISLLLLLFLFLWTVCSFSFIFSLSRPRQCRPLYLFQPLANHCNKIAPPGWIIEQLYCNENMNTFHGCSLLSPELFWDL